MAITTATNPSVWVTTYGLYNQAKLIGQWWDLTDFTCKDDFMDALKEYFKDLDPDPEFMNCDWEYCANFVSESHIDPAIWEWMELEDGDKELLQVYVEEIIGTHYSQGRGTQDLLSDAQDAFYGRYGSKEEWAEDWWESTGMLASIPESCRYYIDYEKYARDAECGDLTFVYHDGEYWVFHNN
jgi:antirestriction protein